jgi:hypothetical protein
VAQIDNFLAKMVEQRISHAALISDTHCRLFRGSRQATGPAFTQRQLSNALDEIAPSDSQSVLAQKSLFSFPYQSPCGLFQFGIVQSEDTQKVFILYSSQNGHGLYSHPNIQARAGMDITDEEKIALFDIVVQAYMPTLAEEMKKSEKHEKLNLALGVVSLLAGVNTQSTSYSGAATQFVSSYPKLSGHVYEITFSLMIPPAFIWLAAESALNRSCVSDTRGEDSFEVISIEAPQLPILTTIKATKHINQETEVIIRAVTKGMVIEGVINTIKNNLSEKTRELSQKLLKELG